MSVANQNQQNMPSIEIVSQAGDSFQGNTSFFINFPEANELRNKTQSQQETNVDPSKNFFSQESLRLSFVDPTRSRRGSQVLSSLKSPRDNQIIISQNVITQLEASKAKLIGELKHFQQKYQKMQNDKLELRNEISELKKEISSYKANDKITEDQIYYISCANNRLVDELNFQRELCNDYYKQNLTLKMAVKNIVSSIKESQLQRIASHTSIQQKIKQIQDKIKDIRNEVVCLKRQIKNANQSDKEIEKVKQQLSHYVQNLEAERFKLKGQIRSFQEKSILSHSKSGEDLLERQIHLKEKYLFEKKVGKLEQQNKRLQFQVASLRDHSVRLFTSSSPSSPRYHTNTQYLQKIMTENHFQVQNLKEEINKKEEQIDRLREEAHQKELIHNQLNQEFDRIKFFTNQQQQKLILETEQQIQKLQKQNKILNKKNEQFVSNQKKLKQEIVQKDKIIMVYVQQQKKNKGK